MIEQILSAGHAAAGGQACHVTWALAAVTRLLLVMVEAAALGGNVAADAPLVGAAAGVRPDAFAVDFGVGRSLVALERQEEPAVCGVDDFLPDGGVPPAKRFSSLGQAAEARRNEDAHGRALTMLRYTKTLVPLSTALVAAACVASFSWQSIGTLLVQPSAPNLMLDQS